MLGVGVVLLPLINFTFLFQREKKLQSSKYETTIGQLYSVNRLTCVFSRAYPLFFCVRRLAAVAVIFFLMGRGSIQIILTLYSNILSMIYKCLIMPLKTRSENRIEVFNEVMILVISLNLFTFTDFVPDSLLRLNMGYLMLSENYLMIFVNLCNSLIVLNRSLKPWLRLKRQYKILKLKFKKSQSKDENDTKQQESNQIDKSSKVKHQKNDNSEERRRRDKGSNKSRENQAQYHLS